LFTKEKSEKGRELYLLEMFEYKVSANIFSFCDPIDVLHSVCFVNKVLRQQVFRFVRKEEMDRRLQGHVKISTPSRILLFTTLNIHEKAYMMMRSLYILSRSRFSAILDKPFPSKVWTSYENRWGIHFHPEDGDALYAAFEELANPGKVALKLARTIEMNQRLRTTIFTDKWELTRRGQETIRCLMNFGLNFMENKGVVNLLKSLPHFLGMRFLLPQERDIDEIAQLYIESLRLNIPPCVDVLIQFCDDFEYRFGLDQPKPFMSLNYLVKESKTFIGD